MSVKKFPMTKKSPEQIKNLLKTVDTGIMVTFTKADGTERKMKATLFADLLPPKETETTKTIKESTDAIRVYDLEKKAWRSFRYDSIISISTN